MPKFENTYIYIYIYVDYIYIIYIYIYIIYIYIYMFKYLQRIYALPAIQCKHYFFTNKRVLIL